MIDIATREDFANIDMTVDVSGELATYDLSVDEGTTYYWRVRSDATLPDAFGIGVFTVLFDTLYVACPASKPACRSSDGIGSKNTPLASVSRAVTLAIDRDLPIIAIAARGGSAGYHEPIGVTGGARTLRGGFKADFSGEVDDATDPTLIFYEGTVLTVLRNAGPLHFERLTLRAVPDPVAPTQALETAIFQGLGATVTVTASTIETADIDGGATPASVLPFETTGVAVGISDHALELGPGTRVAAGQALNASRAVFALNAIVHIDGATLSARPHVATTSDSASAALVATDSAIDVVRLTASSFGEALVLFGSTGSVRSSQLVATTSNALGIRVSDSDIAIIGNRIVASGEDATVGGISAGTGAVLIASNTMVVESLTEAYGIETFNAAPQIIDNTIVLNGATPLMRGLRMGNASHADIAGNLIACLPGAGTTVAMAESSSDCDPLSVSHNVILGCTAAYRDEGTTALADLDTLAGQSCGGACTTRASANHTKTFSDPFTDLRGPDALLATPDNDLRLATSDLDIVAGGVDAASASCGSNETPRPCGNVVVDLLLQARTPPYTVGAYEKD